MKLTKLSHQRHEPLQGAIYKEYLVTSSTDHSLLWNLETISVKKLPLFRDPLVGNHLIVTMGNELQICDFDGKELYKELLEDDMMVSLYNDRVTTCYQGSIRFWPSITSFPVPFEFPGPLLLTNSQVFIICYQEDGILVAMDESNHVRSAAIPKIDSSKDRVEFYQMMECDESVVFLSQDISSEGVEGIEGPSNLFLQSYSTSLEFQYKVNLGKRFGFQTRLYHLKLSNRILVHFEIENHIMILQQDQILKEMDIASKNLCCFSKNTDWIVFIGLDGLVNLYNIDEYLEGIEGKELRIETDQPMSWTQQPLVNDNGQLVLFPKKELGAILIELLD
jgi:hypothetical protein